MPNLDRKIFSNFYLADEGNKTLFGMIPYHKQECGVIGDRALWYCPFSELLLNDDPSGRNQESADMFTPWSDDMILLNIDDLATTPYIQAIVAYDRDQGYTDVEIFEMRGFLLHPQYVGHTFEEVTAQFPVTYTITTDEEGNEVSTPSHWDNR